ncbi:BTAD domain-containing putative transcriptional regulator [Nakamurella sp. GG22]
MADPASPTPVGLTVGVLGPLTVRRDGAPVVLGGHRQSAVLVALVIEQGRVVSTDALLDAVWPDSRPAAPQAALQAHVSHLRKRLDPDGRPGLRSASVERVGSGYALRVPDDAVDAWRFESLVRAAAGQSGRQLAGTLDTALTLWRGPALPEYADEAWARPTVQRWTELRAATRERLYAVRLETGESALLVPELEAFVEEAPLREERWRLLALALYRSHRQADALAALRRVRDLLAEELGVDPGPPLRSLEAEILAQAASLQAPLPVVEKGPASIATAPIDTASPGQASLGPAPLGPASAGLPAVPGAAPTGIVERAADLAAIDRVLSSGTDGDGRVVLIEGPAGIGKTSLLREVRSRAGSARVLAARGSQLEREYGFGVVRQLFEPLVAGGSQDAIFAGAAGPSRSVFQQADADQSGDTVFGVLHGLYWLAAGLAAAGPIVITVDDVQWCDVGSLRFLGFLAHRLEGLPIVLVVTLRTGEQHANEDLLAEIVSEAGVVVITPRPLSNVGVHDLVRSQLGAEPDDAFVATCRRTTGGNPLLLRQLLRALDADGVRPAAANADTVRAIGSRAVSSLVLRRFTRLPAESRSVARAVAVLGDGATLTLVAELAELPPGTVAEAIGSLARSEVLRPDYPLEFVHPLVHDAVYGDIPLGSREMQHERAARLMAEAGFAAEQVAAQLLKSPPRGDPRTVEVLMAAAARSVTRGAPDGAATYQRRALAEPPAAHLEGQIFLELGRVETMTDVPAALEHLTAAYRRLTDVRDRADAAVMLGRVEIFAGARGHAKDTADSIIDELGPEHDDERQWLLAMSRISKHMHSLGPPADEQPAVVGTGPGARSLATTLSWEVTLAGVDRQRAIDLARFALDGPVLDDVDQGFMGVIARNVLQIAEAEPAGQWDDALAKAYRRGSLFAVLGAQVWGGYWHWTVGDLDEALQWLRNCTEQNDLWGAHQIGQTYTDAFMIEVLADRGDLASAQALLDRNPAYWNLISEGHALLLSARARVLTEQGRLDEARRVIDRVRELSDGLENPAWRSWQSPLAIVLAASGDVRQARELLDVDLAFARRWGTARGVGRVLRLRGSLPGGDVEDLRSAVAVLAQRPARLELAKAQAALGMRLSAAGSAVSREAADALQASFVLAAQCSAAGLRRRVEDQLGRLGLPVPPVPRRTALTTTERRMVEMSLDGAFDQEIAQALFITPPTVRQTLAAVRDRLGVTSNDQLRAVAAHR